MTIKVTRHFENDNWKTPIWQMAIRKYTLMENEEYSTCCSPEGLFGIWSIPK